MSDAAPDAPRDSPRAALVPSDRYRQTVESLAVRELTAMCGPEEGRRIAAAFGLAFRQAAAASPMIYDCEPASVGAALAMSMLTRLMPGGPMPAVYLIPRNLSRRLPNGQWAKALTLQWQASWRGLQILAARAGYRVRAGAVYHGDKFTFIDGAEQRLEHEPAPDREETWERFAGCWVVAHEIPGVGTPPGTPERLAGICFMTRAKIEQRRAASDAWKRFEKDGTKGPWNHWPEEMALKTAIRYAISRGLVQLDELGAVAYERDGAEPEEAADAVSSPGPASAAEPKGAAARVREVLHIDAPIDPPPPEGPPCDDCQAVHASGACPVRDREPGQEG